MKGLKASTSPETTTSIVWLCIAKTKVTVRARSCIGLRLKDIIKLFEEDEHTKAIAIIGEIGGTMEEEAAEYIEEHVTKPVVAFIAGQTAPPEKRMGHAGAIITRGRGTAESKIQALKEAGVKIAKTPWELPSLLKKSL